MTNYLIIYVCVCVWIDNDTFTNMISFTSLNYCLSNNPYIYLSICIQRTKSHKIFKYVYVYLHPLYNCLSWDIIQLKDWGLSTHLISIVGHIQTVSQMYLIWWKSFLNPQHFIQKRSWNKKIISFKFGEQIWTLKIKC